MKLFLDHEFIGNEIVHDGTMYTYVKKVTRYVRTSFLPAYKAIGYNNAMLDDITSSDGCVKNTTAA